MYDDHVKRLRNCATRSAPCKTCDLYGDTCCTDTLMKQAADAIVELSVLCASQSKDCSEAIAKYIELWKRQPNWIPVTERLPETHGHYLGHIVTGEFGQVSWEQIVFFDGHIFLWEHNSEEWHEEVTHWMPLPEPPKEE